MAEERGIRLEFAQFGHFDSFEVFRSLTPMDALSLPEPHATGLKTMRFMDNINLKNVLDRDLYYRVRVIRGTESMLSDELQAYISSFEAPKNLSVVFLDNALVSTWELDSPVSKHNYYCSETPIDIENLPGPKAVLAGDARTYVDTDVEVNKTYYTAIGSVKNSVEKLSDISSVFTNVDIYANQVVSLLRFNNNILDETAKIWTVNGTPVFEANQAKYNAWNITSAHDSNLVFDGDFTLEALVTYEDFTRLYNTLIASGNASWSSPVSFVMTYGDTAGSQYVSLRRKMALSVYTNVPLISTTSVFEAGVKTHVAFQRSGSTLRAYKAGVLESSVTFTGTIHFSIPTHGTSVGLSRWDTSNSYGRSLVDAMRITKGVARYNANFTPPVFF